MSISHFTIRRRSRFGQQYLKRCGLMVKERRSRAILQALVETSDVPTLALQGGTNPRHLCGSMCWIWTNFEKMWHMFADLDRFGQIWTDLDRFGQILATYVAKCCQFLEGSFSVVSKLLHTFAPLRPPKFNKFLKICNGSWGSANVFLSNTSFFTFASTLMQNFSESHEFVRTI